MSRFLIKPYFSHQILAWYAERRDPRWRRQLHARRRNHGPEESFFSTIHGVCIIPCHVFTTSAEITYLWPTNEQMRIRLFVPRCFSTSLFSHAAVFPNFSLSSSVHASRSSRWGNLWGKNLFGRTGAFFWGKTVLMPNLRPCSAGLVDRMQRPMWNTWSTRAHPLRLLLEPKELWIKMWTGSAKRHNLVTFGFNCGRK